MEFEKKIEEMKKKDEEEHKKVSSGTQSQSTQTH